MSGSVIEASRAHSATQSDPQIQSARLNSAPGTERPFESLATPHPLTPQQEVMTVGLEAVRDVGLIIEKVKSSRHETLRAIAEDEALRASIEKVATTLSTAGSEFATKNAVIAAARLPALIGHLKPHENTHPSLATIAKLLSTIENDLTNPDDANIKGLQKKAAQAKGAVAQDSQKIDTRNEADARILDTAGEAVQALAILLDAAKGVEKNPLRAIAEDKDLEKAISLASGLLRVQEDIATSEPITKEDAVKIAVALRDLVEELKPHTEQHPSVSRIVPLLQDLSGALLSEKMPALSAFNEKLNAVKSDVEKHRATLTERISAERTLATETPLYQELFGSVEARERHAEAMGSMYERLKDAVGKNPPTGDAMERYGDVGAVLMEMKRVSRESPQE